MHCPFCYVPFDGIAGDLPTWRRIVDVLASWNVAGITFGGGDPFMYDEFPSLLNYARSVMRSDCLIQIDTNGLGIRPEHFLVLARTASLLGLPLDGSTAELNANMRASKEHFAVVTGLLDRLQRIDVPVKVNTVVTKINVEDLSRLARLLASYAVQVWSLYQFWVLGPAAIAHRGRHVISESEYLSALDEVRHVSTIPNIEGGSVATRKRAYFFVTGSGRAYTVSRDDASVYVELGSIFDSSALGRWLEHADPVAVNQRVAMRVTELGGFARRNVSLR